jgi:hypothetical protein
MTTEGTVSLLGIDLSRHTLSILVPPPPNASDYGGGVIRVLASSWSLS